MPTTAEYRANYYKQNKERIDEQKRAYNERSGFFKTYYEENAEKLKQQSMEYYENNKAEISARRKIRYQQKKAQKKIDEQK